MAVPHTSEGDERDPVDALVEEFFERRRRGEACDAREFARRVPGREAQFERLIGTLAVLESAANTPSKARAPEPLESRRQLGRFRLLRMIGRGGMGAVFEAIDDELARHVALKILPGHATLDEREIARFHHEAQAAARLRHPHIVPIFGVGEDDGTHWLAMQLVPGESLERTLRRARDGGAAAMDAREVARHGLAIAEALVCAHAEGVLHRDVKPSNLLLDTSGQVWVTDFGLAKSEGTATLTRTGETVGTPRYMAPEAFFGWADPRTDLWGVGATLYELLAGRPAFDGSDRAQLLRQISDVEPPRLRRVAPAVPRDLATIVHKCLQKEPPARYGSAQELADDLRRFLAGEPIRARPPSVAYRVELLGRRHPIATALLFVALTGGVVMTLREATRARAAEAQAKRRFDDVRKLAGSFLFEIHDAIRNLPGSTAARALIVKHGLEYLDQLAAESAEEPGLKRELAVAYQKVGDVQGNPYQPNLGDVEGARKSYRAAIDLLEPLVESGAATDEDRAVLANAWVVAGGIALVAGDASSAVAMTDRGIALRRALAAADPSRTRRTELATALQYAAYSLGAAGRGEDAIRALDEQARILQELLAAAPDDRVLLRSRGQNIYLTALRRREQGDHVAAQRGLEEAIAIERRLLADDSGNTALRRDLGWTLTDLAGLFEVLKRYDAGLVALHEVIAIDRSLEAADPESRDARLAVAMAELNIGSMFVLLGRPEEALEPLADAITRLEAIVAADPANSFADSLLATACANAGDADAALGDAASLDSACSQFERAIAIFERMEAEQRLPPDSRERLVKIRQRLEACEARIGR